MAGHWIYCNITKAMTSKGAGKIGEGIFFFSSRFSFCDIRYTAGAMVGLARMFESGFEFDYVSIAEPSEGRELSYSIEFSRTKPTEGGT